MATIKDLGGGATEVKIDSLNAVLFYEGTPVAATVGGHGYMGESYQARIFEWLRKDHQIARATVKPQSFFDNILKIYMNPAAFDLPMEKVVILKVTPPKSIIEACNDLGLRPPKELEVGIIKDKKEVKTP